MKEVDKRFQNISAEIVEITDTLNATEQDLLGKVEILQGCQNLLKATLDEVGKNLETVWAATKIISKYQNGEPNNDIHDQIRIVLVIFQSVQEKQSNM